MSDYGMEIVGNANQVQLTSFDRNLVRVFKERISVSIPSDKYGLGYVYVSFPRKITTDELPIVMLRAVSGDLGFGRIGGSDNAWSGFYVTTSSRNGSRDITFEYEAYAGGAYAALTPSTGYGLQMFGSDGDLVFDSEYPPLALDSSGSYTFNYDSDVDDGVYGFELKKGGYIYIDSDELLDTSLMSFVGTPIDRDGDINSVGIGYGGTVTVGYKFFLVPQSGGGNRTEFLECWRRTYPSGSTGTPSRSEVHKIGSYLPPLVVQNGNDRDTTTTYIKCKERP